MINEQLSAERSRELTVKKLHWMCVELEELRLQCQWTQVDFIYWNLESAIHLLCVSLDCAGYYTVPPLTQRYKRSFTCLFDGFIIWDSSYMSPQQIRTKNSMLMWEIRKEKPVPVKPSWYKIKHGVRFDAEGAAWTFPLCNSGNANVKM